MATKRNMPKKEKLTDNAILSHYVKMGEILSEMFKPHLEVAIHDLRYPEHSIIAIFNNQVTGRNVGEGTSDIGYEKLKGKMPEKVVNYKNESPDGKPLKSSSLTIRNSDKKIIGSLGLNYDISVFTQFSDVLSFFTSTQENPVIQQKEAFFYGNTKEDIQISINHFRVSHGSTNKVLSRKDKYEVIKFLIKGGHLNKRGAVAIIGEALSITRPTVYKYIKDIKDNKV
ncbi:MAG: PAS domain-containing protein [Candidatus Marinimicrobia bacterium]|jgi:predicted transcriptional regulator YheO|nr:PAS domain-containing protein [Candidatus Neomarinimicrobiota bacterium]MDP6611937.1 PAS domain-containing protein [Candidatus Neomarinimicrobiota bacterium]|tara:strand:- start:42924 stop:43604 length:681 start_codon:yes stop_codon:yes gene_type:complete